MKNNLFLLFPTSIILLFQLTFQQQCGSSNPLTKQDCIYSNNSTYYCCLLTSSSTTDKLCGSFKNSEKVNSTVQLDNVTYNVDCDLCISQFNKTVIASKYYCSDYSTENNSCCMYNINGKNYCNWLGTKYNGDTTVSGVSYKCSASFIQVYFAFLFFYVLSFL